MESLFEFLLHLLFEILGEIFAAIVEHLNRTADFIADKTNQKIKISFFDEITKLGLLD